MHSYDSTLGVPLKIRAFAWNKIDWVFIWFVCKNGSFAQNISGYIVVSRAVLVELFIFEWSTHSRLFEYSSYSKLPKVGDLNVGIVEPGYSQTRRRISRPVQLHVRASSSHEPITSSQNSTKRPAMFVPPGERHRECCTADTRSCTTTPSARN